MREFRNDFILCGICGERTDHSPEGKSYYCAIRHPASFEGDIPLCQNCFSPVYLAYQSGGKIYTGRFTMEGFNGNLKFCSNPFCPAYKVRGEGNNEYFIAYEDKFLFLYSYAKKKIYKSPSDIRVRISPKMVYFLNTLISYQLNRILL